jgi:hypothetical protein
MVGHAMTNSTGKYTKSFTGTKDGYYRVKSPATTKTRAALSAQRFVDVT